MPYSIKIRNPAPYLVVAVPYLVSWILFMLVECLDGYRAIYLVLTAIFFLYIAEKSNEFRKKFPYMIFQNEGGGAKDIWNFSKKSSVLEA